jgi:hypothetical protein
MQRGRPLLETIHLTALGLWLGVIVMAGAAAAIIFPTVKGLNPVLPPPGYVGYTGDHWLIVAGQVANRVFVAADVGQFVCATLCIVTMGVLLFRTRIPLNRRSAIIRVVSLALAICILGFYSIYLRPRMDINVRGHWEAAIAGKNEDAARFQKIFNDDHPLASNLMKGIALTVLISMIAGAWNATTSGCAPALPPPAKPKASKYEEPALLRSRR